MERTSKAQTLKMRRTVCVDAYIDTGCAICAERTAVVKLITTPALCTKKIYAVAVSSDGEDACTPCGICRQVLREFCAPDTAFLFPNKAWRPNPQPHPTAAALEDLQEDNLLLMDMQTLLPASFGPSALAHGEGSE